MTNERQPKCQVIPQGLVTIFFCFTEFAVCRTTFHHVDMSVRGQIPTCDLIGQLFLGSGLKINTFFAIPTMGTNIMANQVKTPIQNYFKVAGR
jgi:hypothetical protein